MISKLPKWVEFGALVLSLIAGFVNAVGVLGFDHQSISHLSGTATLLGTNIFNYEFHKVFYFVGILLSFLFGAAIAGFLLHSPTLKLGRYYDTALFIEFILLLISSWLLSTGSHNGYFFASAACGLQNALATTYSGAVIRTTHVTGIFTDLGIMLGAIFRGDRLDKRKMKLFVFIIFGFISGGGLGALCFSRYQFIALLFPAFLCLTLSVAYRTYLNRTSSR